MKTFEQAAKKRLEVAGNNRYEIYDQINAMKISMAKLEDVANLAEKIRKMITASPKEINDKGMRFVFFEYRIDEVVSDLERGFNCKFKDSNGIKQCDVTSNEGSVKGFHAYIGGKGEKTMLIIKDFKFN